MSHASAEREDEDENITARKQMHGAIVDYLKGLRRDQKATVDDIEKELGINLNKQHYVLDMIKSNPKVEVERDTSTMPCFSSIARNLR